MESAQAQSQNDRRICSEDEMTLREKKRYEAWIEAEYQKAKRNSANKEF